LKNAHESLEATEIDGNASGRPRRSILPTAKVTDPSNSSKPVLKSHKAAVDAQRALEAQKAAELKAQQVADGADTDPPTGVTGPSDSPLISLSRSSSQVIRSQNTSPDTQSVPSDDEPEECVRPPKGKRKAIGTLTHVHTIRSLIRVLILVDADMLSESSTVSESIRRKKKCMYAVLSSPTYNNDAS
jgi:hypothetical protein